MPNFHRILALIIIFCFQLSDAQVQNYIRKAENSVERGNLREAISYLNQALQKEPGHQKANMEMGLIYSELLDNYKTALPYLEKAYTLSQGDSMYDLLFALAKSYHYNMEFEKALLFYNRLKDVQDLENEGDFQKELGKRKQDCEYAMSRLNAPADDNLYLVNAGRQVNTEMPEYVPVLTGNNELLFTSKRKDDDKEELNYLDGKYFESMYLTKLLPNGFSQARRYTLPDKLMNSKFYKHHQAVVSLSQDGKKLFTFRDSKLFEIGVNDRELSAPAEVKINQFNHYQNHAFLTQDGNTLYFTSDVPGGLGGTDIYTCSKNSSGDWDAPRNLGEPVNTAFDEDAPFLAKDGTLYFASEGHPGYGNYDIYRCYLVDGKWSSPENLGAPINSTAHDIFLVTDSSASQGYFSSGRAGGFGDMDIYKVVYLDKINKDCPMADNPLLGLLVEDKDTSDFKNTVVVSKPANYSLLQAAWTVDGESVASQSGSLEHDYKQTGKYKVGVKLLLGCDTCMMPFTACPSIENTLVKIAPPLVVVNDNIKKQNDLAFENGKDKVAPGGIEKESGGKSERDKLNKAPDNKKESRTTEKTQRTNDTGTKSSLAEAETSITLHFEFNSAGLQNQELSSIDSLARAIGKYKKLSVYITGYADARGSQFANQVISNKRAKATRQQLIEKGIKTSSIKKVEGKGASNFVNNCSQGVNCEEREHAANRRVEIKIKYVE